MMNPEIKAKWVAALRSGEYKQGHNNLRSADDTYCCLGVLCDLLEAKWEPSKFTDLDMSEKTGPYYFEGAGSAFPSDAMLKATGLEERFAWDLAYRNDGKVVDVDGSDFKYHPHTFEEIANIIEAKA